MFDLKCNMCTQDIPAQNIVGSKGYCSCGNVVTFSEKKADKADRMSSFKLFTVSVLFVGLISHVIHWDTFAVKIVPLKIKQWIGAVDAADLRTIAKICEIRKHAQCEAQALEQLYGADKNHIELLKKIAEIYFANKQAAQAALFYTKYLQKNAEDFEARYRMAQALEQAGDLNNAKVQYRMALKHDSNNQKFNVARSYVELLIKTNDLTAARDIIAEYRKSSQKSVYFLEKEWQLIHRKMDGYRVASKKI